MVLVVSPETVHVVTFAARVLNEIQVLPERNSTVNPASVLELSTQVRVTWFAVFATADKAEGAAGAVPELGVAVVAVAV